MDEKYNLDDGISQEELNELYNDILEFGDSEFISCIFRDTVGCTLPCEFHGYRGTCRATYSFENWTWCYCPKN